MLARAQSRSTRTVITALLRGLVVVPVLVLSLALVGPAWGESSGETGTSGSGGSMSSGEGAQTSGTGSPEPAAPVEQPAESPPPESTGPPEATHQEVPAEAVTPPAEAVTPPAEAVTPPAEAVTPPAEAVQAPGENASSGEEVTKTEGSTSETKHSSEGLAPKLAESQSHAGEHGRSGEGATPIQQPAGPGVAEIFPPGPLPPTGSEIVRLGTAATARAAAAPLSQSRAQVEPRTQAERRVQQRTCELSLPGAPGTEGCAGSWRQPPSAGAAAPVLAPISAPLGEVVESPVKDGAAGSGDSGHPVAPEPGPAPGGAGVGVAAGGGGAAAGLAGFLAFTGLLLLAAPRALRRMRHSCRPYRTAFFVLIPERPG